MSLTALNRFLADNLFYLLLGILLLNMLQRRERAASANKRLATFYLAVIVLAWMIGTILIVHFGLPDALQLLLIGALGFAAYHFRVQIWPFRRSCLKCGGPLSGKRILYHEANLCENCEVIPPGPGGSSEPGGPGGSTGPRGPSDPA